MSTARAVFQEFMMVQRLVKMLYTSSCFRILNFLMKQKFFIFLLIHKHVRNAEVLDIQSELPKRTES